MTPDEDPQERAAQRRHLMTIYVIGGIAVMGMYAAGTWYNNRVFERAIADLAAARRRAPGTIIRTTPETVETEAPS